MILRIDRLAIELPAPAHPSPNSASAVQELMGGKFGEMSTLMNYTFQSFNFRGRDKMKPFYDLIANIAAEEYGHIELVSHTINMLLTGSTARGSDPSATPLEVATDTRNHYHFIASGQSALPVDSQGNAWNGTYVFSSGNLKLDLLHNFFLECGARANKIRVYEMVDDPVAREMVGYLLVRGGTHVVFVGDDGEERGFYWTSTRGMVPLPTLTGVESRAKRDQRQRTNRRLRRYRHRRRSRRHLDPERGRAHSCRTDHVCPDDDPAPCRCGQPQERAGHRTHASAAVRVAQPRSGSRGIRLLSDFQTEVSRKVADGALTPAEGQALIAAAAEIRTALAC